jgi:hypothetical protein
MPVILATQEARDQEDLGLKPILGRLFKQTYLEKGLVEWLNV